MRQGIFKRIFVVYAFMAVVSFIVIELYITAAVRQSHIDSLSNTLENQITLIADTVDFRRSDLDSHCAWLKSRTGARVTVVAPDGRVLGDSDSPSRQMDNHAERAEIAQAMLRTTGSSVRYSNTLKYDFLYVAQRVSHAADNEGFIRLAVPLRDVAATVNRLRIKLLAAVGLLFLATWAVTTWQTDHLRRLLLQIRDFSRSLAQGEITSRLFLQGAGEFEEIAHNLTSMSSTLQKTMNEGEDEKERLNVILRSIPDALLIIDMKGIVRQSSAAAREFFGTDAVRGRQFMEVVRNNEFDALITGVRGTMAAETAEITVDHPEERHLSVNVSPLLYKGEISGFVAVFHDITQMKRLEQVRKDFVANVSHEIKTPITAIKGFADTLLEGAIDEREDALKFLLTIKANSERINSLVDDLMTISKIELGVIRIEKAAVDVADVAESVRSLLEQKAGEKGLTLSTAIDPAHQSITADKDRVAQILTNLVDNAIKFTEKGRVTFGVTEEAGRPVLFVEDTGIGIPSKHLPRLGERFYRVDPARSRKMGGTGLGLAIVKHLVRAHGWDMQIESTPGKGTRVRIIIQ